MSNITKIETQRSITALHDQGWSERRIARELGILPNSQALCFGFKVYQPAHREKGAGDSLVFARSRQFLF